jgi:hypothetical protein
MIEVCMVKEVRSKNSAALRGKSHMPENSFFYEKAVPVFLVVLGLVMLGLILFAAGVLLGLVRF